jgi:hypothetical protein
VSLILDLSLTDKRLRKLCARFQWLYLVTGLLMSVLPPAQAAMEESPDPLAVGNRWEASMEISAPNRPVMRGKAHREITGTEMLNGKLYFVSVTRFSGLEGFQGWTTFRRQAEDGIRAIYASDPEKREYLETALPLKVGRTWTMSTSAGHTLFRVTERETVKVGKREYKDCFKLMYDSTGTLPRGHFYLAPGIGNVSETFEQNGAMFRITLESFVKAGDSGPRGIGLDRVSPHPTQESPAAQTGVGRDSVEPRSPKKPAQEPKTERR